MLQVVKATTVQIVLTIALNYKWMIRQLDVYNAFLNGDLEDKVFMVQPHGFSYPSYPDKMCKLNKALNGLKQTP